MIYNQYQTNARLQQTLDNLSSAYQTDTLISQLNEIPEVSTNTVDPSESIDMQLSTQTSNITTITSLEYSSAITYLTKVQEVSSSNNSSSLLALIYTIISSLVLTYGAKMLRLGENDKNNLIQEISEKSRNDISVIENQLIVRSSISNAVTAVNSATSALQLVFFMLSKKESHEEINTSLMSSISAMGDRLSHVLEVIDQYSIPNIDYSELDSALSLFEHHYEMYKNTDLPYYINDKTAAETKVNKAMDTYKQISEKQSSINKQKKSFKSYFTRK